MVEVIVSINDEIIELTGKEAEDFEKSRAAEHAKFLKLQEELEFLQLTKASAKASAKAKLQALGLTDDEINGIIDPQS